MAAKLKVFQTAMGFFDTVVAATSQKAALDAWGLRQDLFKEGSAAVTTETAAIEAALASPGVVLRRSAGTTEPFRPASESPTSEPPASLPKPPPVAKSRRRGAESAPAKAAPKPKPPPDRSALTIAETAVAEQAERLTIALDEIAAKHRALDAQEADLRTRSDCEQAKLQVALDRTRADYVKAGGAA